ncbi:MAG: hypothetical protein WDN28_05860 [Chthoniobacter sp.]
MAFSSRGADLAAEMIHLVVGQGTEFALQILRQFDAELALEQVGDATLAALRIHGE